MALTPTAQDPVGDSQSILEWYDASRPIFIDLVGDYAGKELFLVEGDSMLRECFSDKRIDFQGGFQLLHAVFAVERFLLNLLKRHCQFHIAFFDGNSEFCVPSGVSAAHRSRYLLARAVIKRHLTARPFNRYPIVQVNNFPSLESDEFSQYLQQTPIHFVMSHDGASTISNKPTLSSQHDELEKALLRGIIWFFNVRKLNVALVNCIEFRDSKVFTMIVESSSPLSARRTLMDLSFPQEIHDAKQSLAKSRSADVLLTTTALDFEDTVAAIRIVSSDSFLASYALVVHAVSSLVKAKNFEDIIPSAFALHSVFLKHLPLSQRRFPLITFNEEFEEQINLFLASLSEIVGRTMGSTKYQGQLSETIDFVDGRLFRVVMQAMCEGSIENNMLQPVTEDWNSISGAVEKLTGEKLSTKGRTKPISSTSTAVNEDTQGVSRDVGLLPFSNTVFDKHLGNVKVETDTSLATRLSAMRISRETNHWHNYRKPLNPKYTPAPKVSKWRNPLRTNQFYMSEMTKYAASLTGAKGKALDPETITVGPKVLRRIAEDKPEKPEKPTTQSKKQAPPEAQNKEKKGEAKKGTKKAAGGLSKKDQMKADNLERKGDTDLDKALNAWIAIMKGLDGVADDQERYLKAVDYLNGLDTAKTIHLEAEISAYMLQALLSWWEDYCKADKKAEGYHVVALIWSTIRSICSSRHPVTKVILEHMEKICSLLGISNALIDLPQNATGRKLSFQFKYPIRTQSLDIGMEQYAFQLDHCGPYMDRMLDAKADPRVSNFIPDGWQRKVLDQLDANKSVFVVAPTSAGKTFISFYAMEQVLRADNDGVLVFVAPTKALVNQIAAEVQARFSKRFPLPGKGVWAIHTRDYRVNNPTGCQILVTVPHILQTMLLSPSNAKSWAPRVRRIIFDEIHSIGQAEDGVVWEQLLLLAPCPIIALSATVGNPEQFSAWLAETQKSLGAEIKMIEHKTRYSDLRKYFYEPPKNFRFSGLGRSFGVGLGLDGLTGFEAVHPVSSLVDKSSRIPDDLALEPRDCLSLWRVMVKFETNAFKVPASLHPSTALPPCIRKADIFAWEKKLKDVLQEWMVQEGSPFDQVLAALTPDSTIATSDNLIDSSSSSVVGEDNLIDPKNLKETTLPLLLQLHKRRALPAILFNYDRLGCEEIASALLHQLVDAESRWKESPQWKKLIEGHERYLELKEKQSKKSSKPAKVSKKGAKGEDDEDAEGRSKTDRMRDDSSEGSSFYDLFDPEAPQLEFSFANPKNLQASELAIYVRQLRRKGINEDLIGLLQRGIGVHHSGMNRKYRQCIEMLFRKGFLRVVVATGTLSLGINMPCATVVFSGDSVYLTALNFRQAAGRSGRRGFDLLGNVVFQGFEKERASRLLSSKLPELTGHFPVTTTLVLRLFTLLNDSKSSPYAINAISSLLSQPRLYLDDKESHKSSVLHYLRFSIEYLRRNELLGSKGEPINFTNVVSHLYFTDNSSFAFHALLKGGYFHKLCADIETNGEAITHEMMLTMSHLFGRRGCRDSLTKEEADKTKRPLSLVTLPKLPKAANQILRQHNKETLDIFTNYATTFVSQHIQQEESKLPLSETHIGRRLPKESNNENSGEESDSESSDEEVEEHFDFLPALPAPKARSAFVALSGHGDTFTTIEDLSSSAREGVFLESAVIPHLDLHPDENEAPLNAYLLDFFIHGALDPLEKENGIQKSEVWFYLNDFSMILATICTSLAIHLGLASADSDSEMLEVMGTGEAAEAEEDEKEAAALELASASSIASGTTNSKSAISSASSAASSKTFSKSKKKVADDWDADEDEMAAEEKFRESERVNGGGTGSKSDDEEYEQLVTVHRAFKKLRAEFDEKFKAIFA